MNNLQKQAEELMPKDKPEYGRFIQQDETDQNIGYNQALADSKSQIPAILQMIKKEIEGKKLKYELSDNNKIYNLTIDEVLALFNEN